MNRPTHDRASLIEKLTRLAANKSTSRFRIATIFRHDKDAGGTRRVVVGLEEAGSSTWRRNYISVEEGVLDYDAWPKTQGAYGPNLSYIGIKRILKILGADVDVRAAQRAEEEARERRRARNRARSARSAWEEMDKALTRLVEGGSVTEEQAAGMRAEWTKINGALPAEEEV